MPKRKNNSAVRRRLVSSWISTVISLSLVLLLVGVAVLLLVNARRVSDYILENMQVSVILKEEVTESEALAYQKQLDVMPGVRKTGFVSRQQGVEEMARMLGRDFLDVFDSAPVPISIDVGLEAGYVRPDSLELVRRAISASPLVEEVIYQSSLVEALDSNLGKLSAFMGILLLLLLFISVVLIANTVRLNLFSRRFSIYTMQLVGATDAYIRRPFMLRAAIQGLFAAMVAIGVLIGGMFALRNSFVQLFNLFDQRTLVSVMLVMAVFGVILCTVSTFIVVGKILRYDRDQLYSTY